MPRRNATGIVGGLIMPAVTVAMLRAIELLMSAMVADRMSHDRAIAKHDGARCHPGCGRSRNWQVRCGLGDDSWWCAALGINRRS
jgi:hypothetical protein